MSDKFINRKSFPLPDEECKIKAMVYDDEGDSQVHICTWKPFIEEDYPSNRLPSEGYLGTAEVIEGDEAGLGFHCWRETNSDFIYYCLIED